MKNLLLTILCISFIGMYSCDVEQTQEGEMPEVDVDVEGGEMPEYDVEWADVDVTTTTKTVKVPKVSVSMEEEQVEVPVIDVRMPNDDEEGKEERTLIVEAEVSERAHELDIVEVYATQNRLYVISELSATDQDLQDQKMRVSDRVVLNASDDLDVRYYIIGEKPTGDFNNQYQYIQSREAIADQLQRGKKIYSS